MKKLFIILLLLFSACTSITNKFFETAIIQYKDVIDADGILLIIPSVGCTGCITGAEYFINENFNKYPNAIYVFTNISSVKLMKLKMPLVPFDTSNNIIIDTMNKFYDTNNPNKIYPTVIHIKNHKVVSIDYISPEQKLSVEELMKT